MSVALSLFRAAAAEDAAQNLGNGRLGQLRARLPCYCILFPRLKFNGNANGLSLLGSSGELALADRGWDGAHVSLTAKSNGNPRALERLDVN